MMKSIKWMYNSDLINQHTHLHSHTIRIPMHLLKYIHIHTIKPKERKIEWKNHRRTNGQTDRQTDTPKIHTSTGINKNKILCRNQRAVIN